MPVITRSQSKNNKIISFVALTPRERFIADMKQMLKLLEEAAGMENKMKIALKIFEDIDTKFKKYLVSDGLHVWIKFIATIFNKTTELTEDRRLGKYFEIDENLVEKFFIVLNRVRNFTYLTVKEYCGVLEFEPKIFEAKKEIKRLETMRILRNINRVNYTGMDSIEPENEFDGITDIWADLTINEDPNYEEEDDEDEDDEDEEDEIVEAKATSSVVHPELTTEEKSELKDHLSSLSKIREKRNIPRVNYAGMDMNEEDEGKIHVNKRWFENGKVKYIWNTYSLSQANEIGDEDYIDEL